MGVTPPRGRLFTHYKAPMRCRCNAPGGVPRLEELKVGAASASSISAPSIPGLGGGPGLALRFLSAGWGDVTMEAAARKAGVEEILYPDYELLSVLGVYRGATVIVYSRQGGPPTRELRHGARSSLHRPYPACHIGL